MARIRTIKPEFYQDEDLASVSEPAFILAAGLLNHADDEGYFRAHPGLIKAAVFPLREPSVSIQDMLSELSNIEYLTLFEGCDGKQYGQILGFTRHQVINRPSPSKIKHLLDFTDKSVTTHGELTRERKGKERKGTGKGTGKGKEEGVLDKKNHKGSITLKTYLQTCEQQKVDPIPEDDTIFDYAHSIKLPHEFLDLCWHEFVERYIDQPKRYKDWRAAFRNCVRGNWYHLWWVNVDGDYQLTTTGMQAKKKQEAA